MTELVKAGEQDWAAVLLLLLPVCDVYTGCTGHTGLVSADYTTRGPGDTQWCKRAESPGSRQQGRRRVSGAGILCLGTS